MPQQGLDDWIRVDLIDNPWQAVVLCVLIFALLIWPQMSARQTVKRVEKTLTTNNGGSTVKDSLDQIKKAQAEQGEKLDQHITASQEHHDAIGARLGVLEGGKRRRFGKG